MKNLIKSFFAVCLMFVMSFSLVACSSKDKNKDKTPPAVTNTYIPPEGVDMTSAREYALWLKNNSDITLSYETTITEAITSSSMKYKYKDGIIYVAQYDEDNKITSYMEIEPIAKSASVKNYDVNDLTTSINLYTDNDYLSFKGGYYFADSAPNLFLTIPEVNYEGSVPETVNIVRTIENISDGKYLLKTTMVDIENSATNIFKYTFENNKITSIEIIIHDENSTMTKTITYDYKDVQIVFDKKKPMDNPLDDFYTPPEGVNMSSAEAYGEWLSNNFDKTLSYEVKSKVDDYEINMRYVYKDGMICLAFYDENKNITNYQEWTYFTDSDSGQEKVLIKSYDVKNKTYSESETINDYNFFIGRHNMLCFADTMPFFFLNFPELNLGDEIPSNIKITREIKKVSNGVYNLKTNIKDTQTNTTSYIQFVFKNDRIISYGSGNSSAYVTIATFDYENVSIDFDKNGYTQIES